MAGGLGRWTAVAPTERAPDGLLFHYAPNRAAWRRWLERHHTTSPGVWLVYYKRASGKPRVEYNDAVEEALCFGWIDSRLNGIDEWRSRQLFTPRRPKSAWSASNKERVERLVAAGLMTDAGLAAIEVAKANGMWTAYDDVAALTMPDDLRAALSRDRVARLNFEGFSKSARKGILWWIQSAKRPETRARRVSETVRLAHENRMAGFPPGHDHGPKPKPLR